MERYHYIDTPTPLTYDAAIYWTDTPWFFEWMVNGEDTQFDAMAHARGGLVILAKRKALELGWVCYTTIEDVERRDRDWCIRHELYEQPGYREIRVWRVDKPVYELRVLPQGGAMVTLILRRMIYRDMRVYGVLHDGTLHVVLPTFSPPLAAPSTPSAAGGSQSGQRG